MHVPKLNKMRLNLFAVKSDGMKRAPVVRVLYQNITRHYTLVESMPLPLSKKSGTNRQTTYGENVVVKTHISLESRNDAPRLSACIVHGPTWTGNS